MEKWEGLSAKLVEVAFSDVAAQSFKRDFFPNASECGLDKQGRIPIPQWLRDYINVEKETVIIGMMDRVEIWSKEGKDAYDNEQSGRNREETLARLAELGI